MSSSLRQEIYNRMNLKESDELLSIWRTNNRGEWSDEAFDITLEILKERNIAIPEQDQPTYQRNEEKETESHEFSEEELRILDDENPPAFYDPFDALLLTRQIEKMALVMVGFSFIYNLINFPQYLGVVQSYFMRNLNTQLIYVIAGLFTLVNVGLSIIIVYFPLKALSRILRILMEMEFRSRKAN